MPIHPTQDSIDGLLHNEWKKKAADCTLQYLPQGYCTLQYLP